MPNNEQTVTVTLPLDGGDRVTLEVTCEISGSYYAGDLENPPESPEVNPYKAVEIEREPAEGEPVTHATPVPFDLDKLNAWERSNLECLTYSRALEACEPDGEPHYDDEED